MSTLRKSMEEYLTMRRRLGFKLHEAGQRLEDFVCYITIPLLARLRMLGPALLIAGFYLAQRYGPHSLFWEYGY